MPTYFSNDVVEMIRNNAGPFCSAQFCRVQVTFGGPRYLGEIAHIYGHGAGSARSELLPPAFDPHGYDNAILLCRTCHRMIDRCPELFPPDVIIGWKQRVEQEFSVGSRLSAIPVAVNLRKEYSLALEFIQVFVAFSAFMQQICVRSDCRVAGYSSVDVTEDAYENIRSGANALNHFHRDGTPYFLFQHQPFRNWMSEIIRSAEVVKRSPEFTWQVSFTRSVDFHYVLLTDDEANPWLSFTNPTARAMHELNLLIARFQQHLLELHQQGM